MGMNSSRMGTFLCLLVLSGWLGAGDADARQLGTPERSQATESADDLIRRAESLLRDRKHDEAIELLRQAKTKVPSDVRVHYGIAIAAAELGLNEEGSKALDELLRLKPELASDGEIKRLLDAFRTASAMPSRNTAHLLQVKSAGLLLGRSALSKNPQEQTALATQAFDTLLPLVIDPRQSDVEVWRLVGVSSVMLKRRFAAELSLEAITRLAPDLGRDEKLLTLAGELALLADSKSVSALRESFDSRCKNYRSNGQRFRVVITIGQAGSYVPSNADLGPGVPYQLGEYFASDHDEAVADLYRRAAEAGDATAMACWGKALESGKGAKKDELKALHWYRQSHASGSPLGAYNLAKFAYHYFAPVVPAGESEPDAGFPKGDEAVQLLTNAAESGLVNAMVDLGSQPFHCPIVRASNQSRLGSLRTGLYWLHKAADLDERQALYELGEAYRLVANAKANKLGPNFVLDCRDRILDLVKTETFDESEAEYRRRGNAFILDAAKRGQVDAMRRYGVICTTESSDLATRDVGWEWLQRAADCGDAWAAHELRERDRFKKP